MGGGARSGATDDHTMLISESKRAQKIHGGISMSPETLKHDAVVAQSLRVEKPDLDRWRLDHNFLFGVFFHKGIVQQILWQFL